MSMAVFPRWYYSCNNKTFLDKISSIEESVDSNLPIYFHIPDYYEAFPMHVEPAESWQELCKQHAQEIRDSFDYVRISYSGGCDSGTVLDTFIYNNIHIDEILCIRCGIKDADYEIDQYAIPHINKIKNLIPKTKINIVTATQKDYEELYNTPYWYEETYREGESNASGFHFRLNNLFEDVTRYTQKNKTAHVFGREKPKLVYNKGRWYTYFMDLDVYQQPDKDLTKIVNFYIDKPKIHAKQCHSLLKAIKENVPFYDFNKVTTYDKKYEKFWNKNSYRFLSKDSFPEKLMNFSFTKTPDLKLDNKQIYLYSEKDRLALKTMVKNRPDLVKKWQSSLNEFALLADGKWFNAGRPEFGTIGIFSKFFCLDIKDTKTVDDLYPDGFKI